MLSRLEGSWLRLGAWLRLGLAVYFLCAGRSGRFRTAEAE
jgi:hypothetical protein